MSRQIQKCFMAQIIFLEKNSKYESLNHLYFSQNFIFWGLLYRVLGSAFSKTFCCRPNMIDIFTQPPPLLIIKKFPTALRTGYFYKCLQERFHIYCFYWGPRGLGLWILIYPIVVTMILLWVMLRLTAPGSRSNLKSCLKSLVWNGGWVKYFQLLWKTSVFVSWIKKLHVPSDFHVNVGAINCAFKWTGDCNGET